MAALKHVKKLCCPDFMINFVCCYCVLQHKSTKAYIVHTDPVTNLSECKQHK